MSGNTIDCGNIESKYLHQFWDLFCERHPWRATESLCFVDAYWAKEEKKITETEYITHLVAHYRGIRHPPNEGRLADICQVTLYEPFAGSIRKHALESRYRPPKGTKRLPQSSGSLAHSKHRYPDPRAAIQKLHTEGSLRGQGQFEHH